MYTSHSSSLSSPWFNALTATDLTQQANYRSRIPAGKYILSYPRKKEWKLPDKEINPLQPKEKKWEVKCGTELKK